MNLFSSLSHDIDSLIENKLIDGEVMFLSNFIDDDLSFKLYNSLIKKVDWKHEEITLFGKTYLIPRLTAWYGDEEYAYSGVVNPPKEPIEEVKIIQDKLKQILPEFIPNGVLLNYYRNGKDKMGWHSDDEKELGRNPIIVSVSLGVTRRFDLKHKKLKDEKLSIHLNSGSLLVMKEGMQNYWKHQVPTQLKVLKGRINLTFRMIK